MPIGFHISCEQARTHARTHARTQAGRVRIAAVLQVARSLTDAAKACAVSFASSESAEKKLEKLQVGA